MKMKPNAAANLTRRFMLLAPASADISGFREVESNRNHYAALLAGLQRLRGRVYVDIHLDPAKLTTDGRHAQAADARAWHLISVSEDDQVHACARCVFHDNTVPYADLGVSCSSLARSSAWGRKLRTAIEADLVVARSRGFGYAELGGWAITAALRCTSEAFRMMLALYALSEWFGGALGITTARCACSAPILRRIGGRPVLLDGEEMPPYFDPDYRDDVEILRFDSSRPSERFASAIDEFRSSLMDIPVVSAAAPIFKLPMPVFGEHVPCLAVS